MKKRKVLASDEDLINEVGIANNDTWNGYHGRQKQTRLKKSYTLRYMRRVLINGKKL